MSSDKSVAEVMNEYVEENTPLEGNKCKAKGCGGEVMRSVTGLFRGKFYYSLPACNKCGRVYFFAKDTHTFGEKEFMEILREPMTI